LPFVVIISERARATKRLLVGIIACEFENAKMASVGNCASGYPALTFLDCAATLNPWPWKDFSPELFQQAC
jgi:hypothetical protein